MKTFQEGKHFTWDVTDLSIISKVQHTLVNCGIFGFAVTFSVSSFHALYFEICWLFFFLHKFIRILYITIQQNLSECKIQFSLMSKTNSNFELSGDRKWMDQSINRFICPHWGNLVCSSESKTQSWME